MASCNRGKALSLVIIVLLTAIATHGRYPMEVTAQGELEDKSI
jgi:hypothetical protein